MAVIHDYKCEKHGVFESSHPICPALGCDSAKVTMVFLKAPGTMSARTKQFDKGVRGTSEQYGLPNMRSAQRDGDTSFGGMSEGKVLWGNEAAKGFNGSLEGMLQASSQGIAESRQFAREHGVKDVSSGMRTVATDMGITQQVMPKTNIEYSDRKAK